MRLWYDVNWLIVATHKISRCNKPANWWRKEVVSCWRWRHSPTPPR